MLGWGRAGWGLEEERGHIALPTPPHTHPLLLPNSAYEALQLFSSQAKRQVKDGDLTAGIQTALEGQSVYSRTQPPTPSIQQLIQTAPFSSTHPPGSPSSSYKPPLSPLPFHPPTHPPTHLLGATVLIEQGYPDCGLDLGSTLVRFDTDEADASYDLVRQTTHPPTHPPTYPR